MARSATPIENGARFQLTFKEALTGWKTGDQIVLGGTGYGWDGKDADNSRLQDEVLTITSIKGKEVRFENTNITAGDNTVLRFDHTRSSKAATDQLSLYAANLSRNVSFETENGKTVPISHRAHVMLMHNPNVKILNAAFYDLGRSDKSKLVDDIGKNVDGSPGNGTNIRGRYALHLHKTGVDDINGTASVLSGNVVSGSPGWGIVQHQSHANLEDNVVFDTVGSGIVAEGGNEIGRWTDNIVIKTTGTHWETGQNQREAREDRFDLGFEGDGYWIQGAGQVENKGNKAISSNNFGIVLFGSPLDLINTFRDVTTIPVKNLPSELQSLYAEGQMEVDIRDVPMATISGFESYNATAGLRIWGHNTNFDGEGSFSSLPAEGAPKTAHLGRSLIENFKLWGNRWSGANISYSSNIDLKNGLILGKNTGGVSGGKGLSNNHATFNSTYDNLTIAGYEEGVQIEYPTADKDFVAPTLKNSKLSGNTYDLGKVGDQDIKEGRPDDFGSFIKLKNNQFDSALNNQAPTAAFRSEAIGGLAVRLDAGASADADPLRLEDGPMRNLLSKGIASYGWDLNNDGTPDRFGRAVDYIFDRAGNHDITLTVWDNQGQTAKLTKKLDVQRSDYKNPLKGSTFDSDAPVLKPWQAFSEFADRGWFLTDNASISGGVAQLASTASWGNHIGQVIRDHTVRRGEQTLSFSLKNIEGAPAGQPWKRNEVVLQVWGINGQFDNQPWDGDGPTRIGTLPMECKQLAKQTYGGESGELHDWKKISLDLDLGRGYDYLLFQVNATRLNDVGDDVALDNVSLQGSPSLIPGEVIPFNPSAEPVVELNFEKVTGGLTQDTSMAGVDNAGRLVGEAALVNGKAGLAVAFAGTDSKVTLQNSKDINLGMYPERTISLWFQVDDASKDSKQVIYEEGGSARGLNMYVEDDLLYFGGWNEPESKWQGSWLSTDKVSSGAWHHAALVLDGDKTLQSGALTAYLDGEKLGQLAGSQLWEHSGGIGIGNVKGNTKFHDGGTASGNHGLAGAVDEFKLFNSALDDAQLRQLAGSFL